MIVEVSINNHDFHNLIKKLDKTLGNNKVEEQDEYSKHNKVDKLDKVILFNDGKNFVACGAYKRFDDESIEIKRIFVDENSRKKGIGRKVVEFLLNDSKNNNYKYALLETGSEQVEAINLYKKLGFLPTKNFGPYTNLSNSLCFKKIL